MNILTNTYGQFPNWHPMFDLHYMYFSGDVIVFTVVYKDNPLLRYTTYVDPESSQFTAGVGCKKVLGIWCVVNPNQLY